MRRSFLWAICLATLSIVVPSTWGEDKDKAPKIEPKADAILKKMCEKLGGLKQFTIESEVTYDEVLSSGQKLQLSHRTQAAISAPNRLKARTSGDLRNQSVFYDGKSITIFDRARKVAGTGKAPETLDKLFEHLNKKYALTVPLADLLFSDRYKVFTENVEIGGYVALHQVDGVKCHHLAFRQAFIDWQIWIEASERALPRKIVINYKKLPGQPQHATVIKKWNLKVTHKADSFSATIPKGVKTTTLEKLLSPPESKEK